jgi:hypothetical protein
MQASAPARNRGEIAVRVDFRAIFKQPYATLALGLFDSSFGCWFLRSEI